MLYLPQDLPAAATLGAQTFPLQDWQQVSSVKRVLFLNLMPQKQVTELDIARTLHDTGENVQLIPLKIRGQRYKTTPQAYVEQFYLDFEEIAAFCFDRLIITGAPVEQIPFEEVRYWDALCHIMDWADRHVERTLYICWGAQAGLYHHYRIPKYDLPAKCFGIFAQTVHCPDSFLMESLTPAFAMPNSRHTEVRRADILAHASEGLQLVADSPESGVGVVATTDGSRTFIVGHLEYEPYTLDKEYRRDLAKGLPIQSPLHYYNKEHEVDFVWHEAAVRFYRNWVR